MSRVIAGITVLALSAAPAFAGAQGQPKSTAAAAKSVNSKSEDQKAAEAAPAQPARTPEAQAVNTRIELTITDARGESAPVTKTVSIMTADRSWGRIRTQGEARTPNGQRFPVILNVDARPTMVSNGGAYNRAKVELTIEYRPADEVSIAGSAISTPRRDPDSISPNINESLSVILEDGKPLVISQSADPVTDRKVKVEAKLSILR
jgi:hypothetical protein